MTLSTKPPRITASTQIHSDFTCKASTAARVASGRKLNYIFEGEFQGRALLGEEISFIINMLDRKLGGGPLRHKEDACRPPCLEGQAIASGKAAGSLYRRGQPSASIPPKRNL